MKKLAAILNRHWTILLVFNSLVLAASFGAFSLLKPFWIAKAQLILPETGKLQASLGTLGSLTKGDSKLATKSHPLNMQASIINSDALMRRLLESDPEKTDFQRLVQYKKLFAVSPDQESTTIWLNASGDSPELARNRVKALISAYQERLNELRQADGTTRVEFNKKALDRAKQKLDQSQEALAKFQESSGLVNS
ncbi:MAG: exopolysaccharide biosynthesis protein, partial [Moorea sp. SIO3B2]|nr:exopolysaccharide biosynthesis protein [Moorena sp. SIO3B2]